MKKIFLLLTGIALTLGANAQSGGKSIVFDAASQNSMLVNKQHAVLSDKVAYVPSVSPSFYNKGARTTSVQGRWYQYYELADLNGGNFITNQWYTWAGLWWDSTVTYRYKEGPSASEWGGVCQIFDPIRFNGYNDVNAVSNLTSAPLVTGSDIVIRNNNVYTVDTIRVRAAYIHRVARPSSVRDTLILCVAPITNDWYYDSATNSDWIFTNSNIAAANRVLFQQPKYADSMHRAVFPDNTAAGAVQTLDTFILDPTDVTIAHVPDFSSGNEADTNQYYMLPVGHGAGNTIPAGQMFAVSISFKSGDVESAPNADSVSNFNNFCPLWGFQGTGVSPTNSDWMLYMHGISPDDFNGSSYLDTRGRPSSNTTTYPLVDHSGRPARWLSSLAVQDKNAALTGAGPGGFFDQYLWLDAHVSCNGCKTINDVAGVTGPTQKDIHVNAYPNPANNKAVVSFSLNHASDVTIDLTNVMGQLVATQHFNNTVNAKAEFNVSNMAPGIYFYTVSANGEYFTGRISVAH